MTYYDIGGINTLEIIKAKLTTDEYRGFLKGNILKYMCRAGHKGEETVDYKKAKEYLEWLIESCQA